MALAKQMAMASTTTASLGSLQNPFRHPRVPAAGTAKRKSEKSGSRLVCAASARVSAPYKFSEGGSKLLERPPLDLSRPEESPVAVQEGGDIGRLRDTRGVGNGDGYRVLLLDDVRHTEKLVAKVLPRAVPSITPDDARRLFSVSRQHGVAVVIVAVKEHAEFYSQMMNQGGLRSSIEPDSVTL
ncbi:hypothetical protein Dimus_009976 [Dionaea muscipula]